MIRQYNFEIICEEKINFNFGSIFHGIIMEKLDNKYVEFLHNSGRNPFNIFCYFNRDFKKNILVLNLLTDEVYQQFKLFIETKEFYSNNKNVSIKLILLEEKVVSFDDLINFAYSEEKINNYINFNFVTPTSFKQNGHYINFPSLDLIISSVSKNWDEFNSEIKMFDKETIKFICENSSVGIYNLKSTLFYLEKTKINSFVGNISFRIHGNDNLKKYVSTLQLFSQYSGVGIKTSLGMGGTKNG